MVGSRTEPPEGHASIFSMSVNNSILGSLYKCKIKKMELSEGQILDTSNQRGVSNVTPSRKSIHTQLLLQVDSPHTTADVHKPMDGYVQATREEIVMPWYRL